MNVQIVLNVGNSVKNSLKRVLIQEYDFCKRRLLSLFKINELENFFHVLEDRTVKCFLENDDCCILADNYLIAITCVYFIRSKLPFKNYDAQHFFSALYLAHEMEEDWKLLRNCIVPWFPVTDHKSNYSELNRIKNNIWKQMNYECYVSKDVCDSLMKETSHWTVWNRVRQYTLYTNIIRNGKMKYDYTFEKLHHANSGSFNFNDETFVTSDWEIDSSSLESEEEDI